MMTKTDPNTMPDMQRTTEQQASTPDPFNPTNLRLSQSFVETAGVKKLLTTIPVRKPSPQDFVRVHPDPAYRENFPIIELKDEREEYIVVAEPGARAGRRVRHRRLCSQRSTGRAPCSSGRFASLRPMAKISIGGVRAARPPSWR